MADAYIHSTGSGTSPYDTWVKAANNAAQTQAVLDAAVAGETIHAAGTITLAAQLDIDLNEGNITSGFIKFVGYNASHVNDGTRFILDGNNAATNIVYNNSMNYWLFENIEVKNSNGGDGFTGTGVVYNAFINCCANNNDVLGFDTYSFGRSQFIRCVAYSNTGDGFGSGNTYSNFLFCRSKDNGQSGFDLYYMAGSVIGCITDHNGNDGFESHSNSTVLFNCVSDGNTDDGIIAVTANTHLSPLIGCRVTNHSGAGDIGVDAKTTLLLHGWNYFQDNDGANIQNATLAEEIIYNGASTDVEDQADTECGYTNQDDPEDYNLTDVATSRRTAITIPES